MNASWGLAVVGPLLNQRKGARGDFSSEQLPRRSPGLRHRWRGGCQISECVSLDAMATTVPGCWTACGADPMRVECTPERSHKSAQLRPGEGAVMR